MSRKPARRKISHVIDIFSGHDLEGTVGEAAAFFNRMCNEHGSDAHIDYDKHNAFDDSYSFRIQVTRDETDDEYETRIEIDAANRKSQSAHERKVLEHLAKKLNVKIVPKD